MLINTLGLCLPLGIGYVFYRGWLRFAEPTKSTSSIQEDLMVQYDASLMRVRIRVCIPADVQGIQACVSGDRDNVFEAYQIRVDADQHKLTVWASSGPGQPIRELASFRYWAAYEFLDADGHVMGRARDLQTAEA